MDIKEINRIKTETRNKLDIAFMGICITCLTLLASLKPAVLSENALFTLQLVLAIPLFMCALFARIKTAYKEQFERWDMLAFFCFTLAYGFLVNVIGILLSLLTQIYIVMAFFSVNILLAAIRSAITFSYDRSKLKRIIIRDIFYIVLIVFLGVLPVLGVY